MYLACIEQHINDVTNIYSRVLLCCRGEYMNIHTVSCRIAWFLIGLIHIQDVKDAQGKEDCTVCAVAFANLRNHELLSAEPTLAPSVINGSCLVEELSDSKEAGN